MIQPGGVSLGVNFRVKEVIKLGEDALPALLDCLDKDERMTRTVSYFRSFRPSRQVHYVREASVDAVYGILKNVPVGANLDPSAYGRPEYYRAYGAAARKYWEANRGKPPIVRWHETLCDLKTAPDTRYTALKSIVTDQPHPQWMSGGSQENWPTAPAKMKAEAEALANPTVAEACFRAMDHEIAAFRQPRHEIHRRGTWGRVIARRQPPP